MQGEGLALARGPGSSCGITRGGRMCGTGRLVRWCWDWAELLLGVFHFSQ